MKYHIKYRICGSCMIVLLCVAMNKGFAREYDPLDILFNFELVANVDTFGFNEPSGIVYHHTRNTMFAVGDEGDICELQKDGGLVKKKHIRDADFEGITYDPSSGLVYVAIEGEEKILEIDPETFDVLREFTIPRVCEGKTVLKEGGQGIEAITFIPDAEHPQGGTFLVGNQGTWPHDSEDAAAIFEIDVPLNSRDDTLAKIVRYFIPGFTDIAGFYYNMTSQHLFVVSDIMNALFEMTIDGEIVKSYAFLGDNQEGIAVDDEGYWYITQDSGGIIKLKWLK